ncbi:hypothetical protein [Limnohabitans sp.]|uniref:hypothetical protein n=1 Tax=Limnohabitans sp. TaxID=1907725 RepID=UPI00312032A1
MKKMVVLIAALNCSAALAFDGYEGIKFSYTQKDVESQGYVCKPPTKSTEEFLAKCRHLSKRGEVFGYPAENFEVTVGKEGRVESIRMELVGRFDIGEYLKLGQKIEYIFEKKNEAGSVRSSGNVLRDEWVASNGSRAVLMLFYGVPGVMKTTTSISFWSPRVINGKQKK